MGGGEVRSNSMEQHFQLCISISLKGGCILKIFELRYSLVGQDTRPSPERPGFESWWRNRCSPNLR